MISEIAVRYVVFKYVSGCSLLWIILLDLFEKFAGHDHCLIITTLPRVAATGQIEERIV